MSDEQLIEQILSGNKETFRLLVEKYQQQVIRIAMGYVHSKEDAEDIVQEVFIQVYRSLNSFQGKSEFSTWLYRITMNTSLNSLNKRHKLFSGLAENLKNIFNRSDDEKTAQQQMVESEMEQAIKKAIDQLSDKQRMAFVLSRYEDLSQRKVAEIMETTEGAVEQLLQRAKKNLQNKLNKLVGN